MKSHKFNHDGSPHKDVLAFVLEPRILLDAALISSGAESLHEETVKVAEEVYDHENVTVKSPIQSESADEKLTTVVMNNEPSSNLVLPPATETSHPRELVIVDGNMQDIHSLKQNLSDNTEFYVLNAEENGLEQLFNIVKNHQEIEAIHVVSQGKPGILELGSAVTKLNDLNSTQQQTLQNIGKYLTKNAALMIYGCPFGAGAEGLKAVNLLAELTGAQITTMEAPTSETTSNHLSMDIIHEQIEAQISLHQQAQNIFHKIVYTLPQTLALNPVVLADEAETAQEYHFQNVPMEISKKAQSDKNTQSEPMHQAPNAKPENESKGGQSLDLSSALLQVQLDEGRYHPQNYDIVVKEDIQLANSDENYHVAQRANKLLKTMVS